jgi:LysM repeat protein
MGKKDNTDTPKSNKAKKEKFGNKGTGVLTAVVGVATLGVLALTAITVGKTTAAAQNSANPNGNPTTLELQPEVYDGFMGMMRYFADYDGSSQVASSTPFISDPQTGMLYVIIDGTAYAVVDTGDGLYVADAGSDPEDENTDLQPIEDVSNGEINPNVYTDENGNVYYHVVWGDTLCSISSDLHISVDELAEYNHIRNVHLIYAESDLRIPPESYDPNATEYPRDDASNTASTSSSN